MWFKTTIWRVLAASFFVCTTLAYSSFGEFESSNSAAVQFPSSRKESLESRWNDLEDDSGNNYLYEKDPASRDLSGRFLDLGTWPERDSVTMSRQLFGDKSEDSSEMLSNRVSSNEPSVDDEDMQKKKRESHSLSIVNPLDVLRQRLMLEMARRRMKENQDQIRENAVILKNLGKRAAGREGSRTDQDLIRRIHVSNSEGFDV